MNMTVCSGSVAQMSCDYTGAPDPRNTRPDWRIIKRSNDGHVISNETVNAVIIRFNKTDGLVFLAQVLINNSVIGRFLVGPVDDTYNNTSYQCIFTINDTIIGSDTAGTVTVIGMYVHTFVIIITNAFTRKRYQGSSQKSTVQSNYVHVTGQRGQAKYLLANLTIKMFY